MQPFIPMMPLIWTGQWERVFSKTPPEEALSGDCQLLYELSKRLYRLRLQLGLAKSPSQVLFTFLAQGECSLSPRDASSPNHHPLLLSPVNFLPKLGLPKVLQTAERQSLKLSTGCVDQHLRIGCLENYHHGSRASVQTLMNDSSIFVHLWMPFHP